MPNQESGKDRPILTLDLSACARIIGSTALPAPADAAEVLESALIKITPNLIQELNGEPIQNTHELRTQIRNVRAATERLLGRIGSPKTGARHFNKPSHLSEIILRLSDRPGGPDAKLSATKCANFQSMSTGYATSWTNWNTITVNVTRATGTLFSDLSE